MIQFKVYNHVKPITMKKLIFIILMSLTTASGNRILHSGGTDSMGCHVDHRTGIYHCH